MAQQTPQIPTTSMSKIPKNIINIQPPLRLRNTSSAASSQTPNPPPLKWLERTWSVTHSTLPMWKKAKNVHIAYKVLDPKGGGEGYRLEDTVSYDHVDNVPEGRIEKWLSMRRICGVDYPIGDSAVPREGDVLEEGEGGIYRKWHWKGNGWLKITGGSKWEVLGWGEHTSSSSSSSEAVERWVVTYFEASLFTPAGLDIMYSGTAEDTSPSPELYEKIIEGIRRAGQGEGCKEIAALGAEMFSVKIDA